MSDIAPLDAEHPFSPRIWSANVSVRRSTWKRVGGLDESFREYGGEDTDFGMRVAAAGCPVVFVPDALSYHVHLISYRSAQRQPYHAGRAMVRLAEKFDMPVEAFSGGGTQSAVDRILSLGWRTSPPAMTALGEVLTFGLRASDLTKWRPAQLLATCDEYVAVAQRLATDTAWRATIKERMKHNKHRVYRDRSCITALEEFLIRVTRDRRAG